jgi:hypothetical protein
MHVPIFDADNHLYETREAFFPLAEPGSYLKEPSHLPQGLTRKIMGGNLARLMNAPADLGASV